MEAQRGQAALHRRKAGLHVRLPRWARQGCVALLGDSHLARGRGAGTAAWQGSAGHKAALGGVLTRPHSLPAVPQQAGIVTCRVQRPPAPFSGPHLVLPAGKTLSHACVLPGALRFLLAQLTAVGPKQLQAVLISLPGQAGLVDLEKEQQQHLSSGQPSGAAVTGGGGGRVASHMPVRQCGLSRHSRHACGPPRTTHRLPGARQRQKTSSAAKIEHGQPHRANGSTSNMCQNAKARGRRMGSRVSRRQASPVMQRCSHTRQAPNPSSPTPSSSCTSPCDHLIAAKATSPPATCRQRALSSALGPKAYTQSSMPAAAMEKQPQNKIPPGARSCEVAASRRRRDAPSAKARLAPRH